MTQHQRAERFAGLRAKPQRGPGAATRPPGGNTAPLPRTAARKRLPFDLPILLRAFGLGLIAWGLLMITMAVGFDLPIPH